MANETLEERLNIPKPAAKTNFFDFMTSAYTSSKALKVGQLAVTAGYSLLDAVAMSGIFYLGAKTIWNATKYGIKFLGSPWAYLKGEKTKEMLSEIRESYKPLGRYMRPHLMPPTLQALTYATGF